MRSGILVGGGCKDEWQDDIKEFGIEWDGGYAGWLELCELNVVVFVVPVASPAPKGLGNKRTTLSGLEFGLKMISFNRESEWDYDN